MKIRSKLTVLCALVAFLILLRVSAPSALEYYLNEQVLWDLGDYSGHVENVDLAVWRGAAQLKNVRVEKVAGNEWVRFLTVPEVDVSFNPLALFRGVIQTEVVIVAPELNIVDGADEADKQTGSGLRFPEDPDADPDAEPLFPIELTKLEIRQGAVAFRNFTSDPQVNLPVQKIDLIATNLAVDPGNENTPAGSLELTADLLDGSPFSVEAEFNPKDFRNFMLATDMTFRDLTRFNAFARAYGNIDFNSGHGTLVMEVTAQEGQLTGYAKPAFEDVGVFNWEAEMEQGETNPFQLLWEGVVDVTAQIFSNRETDALATRIDISGEIPESTDVDTWGAVFGIIANAFVEAINTHFEHITPLKLEEKEENAGESDEDSTEDSTEET